MNEFEELKARKEQIDKLEQGKSTRALSMMSVWFTFQFFMSYYCIYEVEWIGWDLFEPMTYTVSQGSALAGVWFVMRTRGSGTNYTDLAEHMQRRRQRRWLKKYNFDLARYHFLEEKIKRIDNELAHVETLIQE